ncbi:MAG TPA: zf-HC2 domain-containing protein [Magnetospirillaceae bacterium]|nr:zf-HC2 domain-containing protein [Magnetospirillaceae bacterium]
MCPERQILSAFVDGEVPSPWAEALRRHVDSCEGCSSAVGSYRAVTEGLTGGTSPDPEAARDAVWTRLQRSSRERRPYPIWKTRFMVPLPVAVAAVLTVVILSTLVGAFRRENEALRKVVFAASEIRPPAVQASAMDFALGFLESQVSSITVTVQLPPGTGFQSLGKPVFMKASDMAPVLEEGR